MTAYVYYTRGTWAWSENPITNQLGQATVAMFFMITGLLFAAKSRKPALDWGRFYAGRIARLAPLYFVVVIAVFALVLCLSGGLRESPGAVAQEFLHWAGFVVFQRPDINGYEKSWTLIAGVNWSLAYEVLFYVFAVPTLHFLLRRASARLAFAVTLLLLAGMLLVRWRQGFPAGPSLFWTHFLCGIVTSYALAMPRLRIAMASQAFRWLALLALAFLGRSVYSYNNVAVLAILIVFASVAGGASIFGILRTRAAIWLGDISYGIYLIHGLLLWAIFKGVSQATDLVALSAYSMIGIMLVAILAAVSLASLSYIWLELPIMRRAAAAGADSRQSPRVTV